MTTLACPAKFNLFLAIGDRDESGYHELDTVFVRTDQIQDCIHIERAEPDSGIVLQITWPNLPREEIPEEKNSVLHAIRLLKKETGKDFNYSITLEKHIPPRSGLGGGASDAAAIILYLNEHEGLQLSHEKLMELAAQIGADVPFFISGYQVARGTHYGEKITPMPSLPENLQHQIIFTGQEVSTPKAFAAWDELAGERGQKTLASSAKLIAALEAKNAKQILTEAQNDFQVVNPEILSSCPPCSPQDVILLAGSGGACVVLSAVDK
jgi:4-diphosphocytidyl-2-C-methyl-D-erythritol kinase